MRKRRALFQDETLSYKWSYFSVFKNQPYCYVLNYTFGTVSSVASYSMCISIRFSTDRHWNLEKPDCLFESWFWLWACQASHPGQNVLGKKMNKSNRDLDFCSDLTLDSSVTQGKLHNLLYMIPYLLRGIIWFIPTLLICWINPSSCRIPPHSKLADAFLWCHLTCPLVIWTSCELGLALEDWLIQLSCFGKNFS